jgi:prepilin-type N-terminal cleavage/methylation domain-containing protein
LGAEFKKLNKAEQAAVAGYVRAEYDKLVFQEPNSYVSRNAQADPEVWLERLRQLTASDRKRVQVIVEQARSQRKTNTDGFTLMEMTIVLTIIGLIAGALLVAQDLIEAAELRSIIKNVEVYRTAVNAFYSKYNCLPGDCPNATTFFGTNPNCPTAGSPGNYPTSPGSQTCNGNGDGYVGDANGSTYPLGAERFLFWQHLAMAGMIPGEYVGISDKFGAGTTVVMPPAFVTQSGGADTVAPNVPGINFNGAAINTHSQGPAGTGYPGSSSCFFQRQLRAHLHRGWVGD